MDMSRTPQLEAEQAVLGSILQDEGITRDALAAVLEQDFVNPVNRKIFRAMRTLFRAGHPVDAITVRGAVGMDYSDYLLQLLEITPTAANWREYADLMRQQAALHRAKGLAEKISEATALDDIRDAVAALGQELTGGRKLDTWSMRDMLDDFYAAQDLDAPAPVYFSYGLSVLEDGTFTQPGDVVMIGGEPSSGKTALSLMMAYHMAKYHRVGYYSLETSKQKVRDRLVSTAMQVDFRAVKQRTLNEQDWADVAARGADFSGRDLTVLTAGGMTATEIQSTAQASGFDVIFVDYVQLVSPEIDRRAPRSEQMADVSRSLHTFAQRTGTLVVELAQLSRPDRSRGWREPEMTDLKESGQFEQDADLILMIYRPNPNDEALDQEQHRILKIAKNKEFRRGKWPLHFDGGKQTFSVLATEDGHSKQVLRQLTRAGKSARQKNRIEALGQRCISEVVELPPSAERDMPF